MTTLVLLLLRGQRQAFAASSASRHHHHHHHHRAFASSAAFVIPNAKKKKSLERQQQRLLFVREQRFEYYFPAANSALLNNFQRHHQQQALHFSSSSSSAEKLASNTEEEEEEEVYRELQWLSTEIRRHDDLYYNNNIIIDDDDDDDSAITDDDYDALVRREEELCRLYPQLQKRWEQESGLGIQATRVGGRVGIMDATTSTNQTTTSRFSKKQKHLVPMLSLDNVSHKTQFYAWLERLRKKWISSSTGNNSTSMITILTEPKLDGLSLSLRYQLQEQQPKKNDDTSTNKSYQYYQLVWASTRGDGKQGQDVTQTIQDGMKNLPFTLPIKDHKKNSKLLPKQLEIRGEVVLHNSLFDKLVKRQQQTSLEERSGTNETTNESLHPNNNNNNNNATSTSLPRTFSNPRNAASGILLRKFEVESADHAETLQLQSQLSFYAYDLVVADKDVSVKNAEELDSDDYWVQDALASRQRLQEWGFQVPEPIAVTTLELKRNNTAADSTDDDDDENQTSSSVEYYQEWTDEDVQPMLEYHEMLGRHREEKHDDDKGNTTNSASDIQQAANRSTNTQYTWGDYDMDGCVHKVSQASIRRLLGTSNRAPRWAVAHKFPSQSAITPLLNVEIQVGRKSGALTPVAILEPIELAGGVTVTRATLHNFQHMQQILLYGSRAGTATDEIDGDDSIDSIPVDDMGLLLRQQKHPLLAKGTKVLVRRAGDVIPQIIQLAEPPKTVARAEGVGNSADDSSWIDLAAPLACPACGSPAVVDTLTHRGRKTSDDADSGSSTNSMGQVLRCGGPPLLCPPRAVGVLVHAYSRDALDISGLSEAKIQQIMMMNDEQSSEEKSTEEDNKSKSNQVKLRFPSDIFSIATDPVALEAIGELPGWGPKSAQNMANAANKVASEGVSLSRFIYSLSIRFAGVHSSKLIASAYGNVTAFIYAVKESADLEPDDSSSSKIALPNTTETEFRQPFGILADKESEVSKGIGPALLSSLVAFSKEKELVQAAEDLANAIVVHDDEDFSPAGSSRTRVGQRREDVVVPTEAKPLQGMKVVFTGSLANYNLSRKDAQALAKSLGAKSTPASISKATDLVVVGEKAGGKKLEGARDSGVRIMEAGEFLALVKKVKDD